MKKPILTIVSVILTTGIIFAQDLIYTVSGEINESKTALDSILVENLTNGTRIVFGDLPEHDYYQINLTKNAYWGTVGINDVSKNLPAFVVSVNTPGQIAINYQRNEPVEINVSVFNVNGQKVYASTKQILNARNSVDIVLNHSGVYFVRVDAPFGSQTFKAIGADNFTQTSVKISARNSVKTTLKNGTAIVDDNFSFIPGDSIRISAYKNEYYARPIGKKIVSSEYVNFLFKVSATVTDSISDAYIELNEITTDVTDYDTITGNVQITYTGENPDLKPGNIIIVDVDTMGYLRKVVETIEDDGSVTVTTEQAYLNELFVGKDFKLHTGLMNPGVQLKSTSSAEEISAALTDEKGYIHPVEVIYIEDNGKLITKSALTDLEESEATIPIIDFYRDLTMDLYGDEGDNVHFYVDEGHVSLTSDAIFEFDFDYEGELTEDTKVKKGDINTFSFYLDSRAEFLTKLALDMSASYEKEQEKRLINLKKITAKFLIGPVPFWVTFDVDVFGNYHINADAALHADWGFASKHTLKIGSTYNRHTDEFTPINEYTPENTVYPLNIEGEINASARFEVYPRAEIKFYSFFGPYAEIAPYANGNYNASIQSQITATETETFLAWNSGIDLGLNFRTGIELTFLGLFNKELVPTVINGPVWPLWSTPTDVTLLTTLPAETTPGKLIPLKFKVTDLSSDPATLCPIYISGDGSFNKQILFTNTSGEATVDWTLPGTTGKKEFLAVIYNADKTIVKQIAHTVQVNGTAPSVVTLKASGETESSAELNGNVTSDGGVTVTQRGFYWSETDDTPDSGDNKEIVSGTTGSFTKTISGLQPNTTYYFRAFATNSKGTTTGDVLSFKTTQELSLPTVQTNTATGVTASSGTLNGNVTSDGNSTITQRGFYWSETDNNPDSGDNKEIVNGTTGTYSKTINSLQANTTYYYCAFATNSEGTATGEVLSFKTFEEQGSETGTFTDPRDGNTYEWVKIGEQVWMAENLAYLPQINQPGEESETEPYYCVYGYTGGDIAAAKATGNYATYGVLYNWPAAMEVCPVGWHLPAKSEWEQLAQFVNGTYGPYEINGAYWFNTAVHLKATQGWDNNGNGTDDFGFSAFPGGYYGENPPNIEFTGVGNSGYWWTDSNYWFMYHFTNTLYGLVGIGSKANGYSIRCIKD
jgi:uncharacterized protein (TIGR02145 family)